MPLHRQGPPAPVHRSVGPSRRPRRPPGTSHGSRPLSTARSSCSRRRSAPAGTSRSACSTSLASLLSAALPRPSDATGPACSVTYRYKIRSQIAEYYASAIYSCCAGSACADVPSRPRGAGALSSPARCRGGVSTADRRQSEARSEEFIKAWEAARRPDDAGGFRVCGEVVT